MTKSYFPARTITIRWSEMHHRKFMNELGGTLWLRSYVDALLTPEDRLLPEVLRSERDAKIIAMHKAGEKFDYIAATCGVSIAMIRYVAIKANLPPRRPKAKQKAPQP